MLMIVGEVLYGKVDEVPGLFYVKTRFVHFFFFPVFPVDSYLIRAGTERSEPGRQEFSGCSIGRDGKSMVIGFSRAFLFVALGATAAGASINARWCSQGFDSWASLIVCLALLISSGILMYLTFRWSRPSLTRALDLAAVAGISPEDLAKHCDAGRIILDRASMKSPSPDQ